MLPNNIQSAIDLADVIAITGSRFLPRASAQMEDCVEILRGFTGAIFIGDAQGVDGYFSRRLHQHPRLKKFIANRDLGRSGFALRSIRMINTLKQCSVSPLVLSFPVADTPVGLKPSAKSSDCFCGLGSGTWATTAYAVGLGIDVLISREPNWESERVGKGWYFSSEIVRNLQLEFF